MTLTDEELDRDWQPSGRRPQSTIARSFSAELMDIFRIENSISDLDEQVHQKKETVDRTTKELASLEARLREMEERLRLRGGSNTGGPRSSASQTPRAPLPDFHHHHHHHHHRQQDASDDAQQRDLGHRHHHHHQQQQQQQQQQTAGVGGGAAAEKHRSANGGGGAGGAPPQRAAPGSGNMPPTPGASEGEYYFVTRADLRERDERLTE